MIGYVVLFVSLPLACPVDDLFEVGDEDVLAPEGDEALLLEGIEHVGDVDAGVVHHLGEGYHAALDLLGTAVVDEVALHQGDETLQGATLVGGPEELAAALDARGEHVEQVITEDIEGKELVDDALLAEQQGAHLANGGGGVAVALAETEQRLGAQRARRAELLGEDEVLVKGAARQLDLTLHDEDDVAAGVILPHDGLTVAVGTEIDLYLLKDGGEVLAAVALKEGQLE